MKVRRVVVVGWVVGLVLAFAVSAQAKGVSGVTLTGGGEEITFEGSGEPNTNTKLSNLAGSARLFQGLESDRRSTVAPSGDLESPITVRWRFPTSATEVTIVVQYLYLDAQDGPIGYIPGGQELWGATYPDAWAPLGPDIADDLAAIGFGVGAATLALAAEAIEPPMTVLATATAIREATVGLPVGSAPTSGASESAPPRLVILGAVITAGAAISISGIIRRRLQRVA